MQPTFLLSALIAAVVTGVACNDSSQPMPTGPSSRGEGDSVTVAGTVSDAAWRPLAGARIDVVSGPGAGLSTTTNGAGGFTVVGAFGAGSQFRATFDGHVAATLAFPPRCDDCSPAHWIHFYLASTDTPVDIAGLYELTFFADSTCVALPAVARSRTYRATITPSSREGDPLRSRFDVLVTDPGLLAQYDRFTIGVVGQHLTTDIGDWGHGGAGLVEPIGANTYVTLGGEFTATVGNRAFIEGPMFGSVDYCGLSKEWQQRASCGDDAAATHATCLSKNHRLSLRRLN